VAQTFDEPLVVVGLDERRHELTKEFTEVAGFPDPKLNTVLLDPVAKPVPVMVTDVPPAGSPGVGLTAATVGRRPRNVAMTPLAPTITPIRVIKLGQVNESPNSGADTVGVIRTTPTP